MVAIYVPLKLTAESMLCIGNGPPRLLSISSIESTLRPRANKLHSNRRRTSLSFASSRASRPLRHVFRPLVVRALDGSPVPSSNGNSHSEILKVLVGSSVVLAIALGIAHANLIMNRKAVAGPRELSRKSPQAISFPLGGKAALRSLLGITASLASGEVERPLATFKLPSRPSMEEVDTIKMQAVQLMKNRKPEGAVDFLHKAYDKYMYDSEPAYNVEMALVEILICQGKYEEALECNCLKDDYRQPSDARFPLYKAIIYTMLDEAEEARQWWEEYLQSVGEGFEM